MAVLNFPASPTVGQVYTANGYDWVWNGQSWASQPSITGGAINNTIIGANGPAAGAFTTLSAIAAMTLSNGSSAAPSCVFSGASTTGFYWANPGVGISSGATSVATFTTNGTSILSSITVNASPSTYSSIIFTTNVSGGHGMEIRVGTSSGYGLVIHDDSLVADIARTDASGNFYFYNNVGVGAAPQSYAGLWIGSTISSTSGQNLAGLIVNPTLTTTTGSAPACAIMEVTGSTTSANVSYGLIFQPSMTNTANNSSFYGLYMYTTWTVGYSGGGASDSIYQIYIGTGSLSGYSNGGSCYQLYIQQTPAVTGNRWGIYQQGTDNNYLGGNLGIATSPAAGISLSVLGAANSYSTVITGNSTTGQSYGLSIVAGTNSSDYSILVQNQSASTTYFAIRGDGYGTLNKFQSTGWAAQSSSFDQSTSFWELTSSNTNAVTAGITLSRANPTSASSGNDNTDAVGLILSGYYQGVGGFAPIFIGRAYNGTAAMLGVSSTGIAVNQAGITGVTSMNSGQLSGFRNRMVNGAMNIDQANAGGAVTVNNSSVFWLVDQMIGYGVASAGVFTAQQTTSTPPTGFVNYLHLAVTTHDTSPAAGSAYELYARLEGQNVQDFSFGTSNAVAVTLSFWVRSSLTGNFSASIGNSAHNRSYPFLYNIASANTWTYITVTIPGDTTGTWLTTNGIGIQINFDLGSGSTYKGTANTWAASGLIGVTGAVSLIGTTSATLDITGIQLEIGSSATMFEQRTFGRELEMCQRYYEKSYPVTTAPGTASIPGGIWFQCPSLASGYSYGSFFFKVQKRISPTMSFWSYAGTSGKASDGNTSDLAASSAASNSQTSEYSTTIANQSGGTVTPAGANAGCHWVADARL